MRGAPILKTLRLRGEEGRDTDAQGKDTSGRPHDPCLHAPAPQGVLRGAEASIARSAAGMGSREKAPRGMA